ncbi:MAG: uroporphyrinogen-III synthase [Ketobacteraceae bacterium]|nr:uroporphyrinogen-III synthase [Ketobacteraceae bacterium]
MSDKPVSVLVTRPEDQAAGWVAAIESRGWQAVVFPTLAICPLKLTPELRQRVLDLDRYQGVICVSANAARLGLSLLSDYWPQWPVRQDWYAVGPATAEVMADYQLPVKVPGRHDSEGVLDFPRLQAVAEQRFLVLKGAGGRDAIQRELQRRGALVDELPLYEREMPDTDLDIFQTWFRADVQHYVAISSGDGLKNFLGMVGSQVKEICQLPLVVVSERLGKFARDQGFTRVLVAQGASGEALAEAISAVEQA